MKRVPIGIDLDGVLCDFETPFKNEIRGIFGNRKIEDTWDFGLNKVESNRVFGSMMRKENFWASLQPYPPTKTFLRIDQLSEPFDIYFITNRTGQNPLKQSTQWLRRHAILSPSVIVTKNKGSVCRCLGVTQFLDDKPSNCIEIREMSPTTRVTCISQSWNKKDHSKLRSLGVGIVKTVDEFLDIVERT